MRGKEYFYKSALDQAMKELDAQGVPYTVSSELRRVLTPRIPGKSWEWQEWRVYTIQVGVNV